MEARTAQDPTDAAAASTVGLEEEETKIIHAIQKAEGHEPCFGQSEGRCSRTACRFMQVCLAQAQDGCEGDYLMVPTLDLEEYEPDSEPLRGVADESKGACWYGLIGVGNCGGALVQNLYDLGYRKVLAVNTSRGDLDLLRIPENQKFLLDIGQEYTGRDAQKSAKAVGRYRQDILHLIRQIFASDLDHIMVCFGAGGGTGSGSVAELTDIAKIYARYIGLKEPDKKVGVLMTLPAAARVGCPVVAENAYAVVKKLAEMASANQISPLITIDNDKISKMYPQLTRQALWSSINVTAARLFHAFNRISAAGSEYTSFDRLDYTSIIESGGSLIMGRTKVNHVDNPFAISEAVKHSMAQTLFAGQPDLSRAGVVGCIFIGNRRLMADVKGLREHIDYAFDILAETTGQATIHRGIYEDNGEGLRVYTIVGGLQPPAERIEELTGDAYRQPAPRLDNTAPLRNRKEDILALAEYFLAGNANLYTRQDKSLSPEARTILLHYPWPGNVDELEKAMARCYEVTRGHEIQLDALPFALIFADCRHYPKSIWPALAQAKRRLIIKTLDLTQGIEPTARLLGIDRARLLCLIENLKIAQVTHVTDD